MKKKHLLTVAVAIIGVFLAMYGLRGKLSDPVPVSAQESPSAVPVRTAEAGKRTILSTLDYTGTVAPAQVVTLAPKITGHITSVSVGEGDSVRAGDVLITIDNEQLQASLARLEAKVEQAQLNLDQQQLEFDRLAQLHEAAAISEQQYDKALFGLNLAAATLKEAQAALTEARLNLVNTKIVAPNNGKILQLMAEPGDLATMGKPLLVLSGGHDLIVETQVIEKDLAQIKAGMNTQLSFPGINQAFTSTVNHIDPSLDPMSRSARVKVSVPAEAPATVLPGMSADVTFILAEVQETLSIPTRALVQTSDSENTVFVITDNKAKLQPVKTGIADSAYVEILEGITMGDVVATDGKEQLYNGAPVFIFNDHEAEDAQHE
ncbi:MAG TPA: efflux RND transporter periplasmic adaptor subunit [Firmicutes bacterium]|nr:efflux RND transporter periplasmic adaptor subunit [Bacillota bacterium]